MVSKRLVDLASRLLLVALLATFLSPRFGWQSVASHDELAHADSAVRAHADHHHAPDAHHDGHGDHDDSAHGEIGHLLSHLPVVPSDFKAAPPPAAESAGFPPRLSIVRVADLEPPYEPPRSSLFA